MIGVKFLCRGICERYNFSKRPDYDNNDMYCRNCEIVITQLAYESLPQINPNIKYCFCCHRRISCRRRGEKSNRLQDERRYDELRTFKELGLESIQSMRKRKSK